MRAPTRRALALLLAFPAASFGPLSAQAPSPPADVLDPDLRAAVPRLVELMRAGIEVTEPNHSVLRRVAEESLFDGSYDLHSCLFATWALLVTARVEADGELEGWLLERLTPQALDAEWERVDALDHERLITFPYDQGWLLLVLSELERHLDRRPESVRAFRLALEERLLDWLEASPFPENDDPTKLGGRRFVGFYRSWLFAWFLVRLSEPVTPGALERLEHLERERVLPERASLAAQDDPHPIDFLWVPSLGYLIDELDPDRAPPPYDPGELPPLPESVSLRDVHVLGVEVSRLWPLAIRAREGDAVARELYHARMREILERGDLWEEDFEVVTHWVPQFLWFGTWLADGRP